MIRLIGMGLLLAIATPTSATPSDSAAPPISPIFHLPAEGSGWIDFVPRESGHILIPVTLNGKPARALVDTGVDQLVVTKTYAATHQLRVTPRQAPTSGGGDPRYYITPDVTLDIGALRTTKGGEFLVDDMSNPTKAGFESFDAIIGVALLGAVEWQVDQDHHRIRFLPSGTISLVKGAPVFLDPRGSRLLTTAEMNGRVMAATMIDTGSDGEVSLTTAATEKVALRMTTDMMAMGIDGPVASPLGRLSSFTIGQYQRDDVMASGNSAWTESLKEDAVIGMGILQRYNMTVDVPAGRMQLSVREAELPPAPKSTSGVQGRYADGRLTIAHVMKNSPAAVAGIKAGDSICSINGKPMSQELVDQKWGRATPGTRYSIRLCDGTLKQIVTRSFY